ncbi:hypothetical protein L9F63_004287, partial [Diploptera punctata]
MNSLVDYQIPLLRVYRKHDRSLQGPTSWIKLQRFETTSVTIGTSSIRIILCPESPSISSTFEPKHLGTSA